MAITKPEADALDSVCGLFTKMSANETARVLAKTPLPGEDIFAPYPGASSLEPKADYSANSVTLGVNVAGLVPRTAGSGRDGAVVVVVEATYVPAAYHGMRVREDRTSIRTPMVTGVIKHQLGVEKEIIINEKRPDKTGLRLMEYVQGQLEAIDTELKEHDDDLGLYTVSPELVMGIVNAGIETLELREKSKNNGWPCEGLPARARVAATVVAGAVGGSVIERSFVVGRANNPKLGGGEFVVREIDTQIGGPGINELLALAETEWRENQRQTGQIKAPMKQLPRD